MITDARDLPLDEYEQELLERLLQAHADAGRSTAVPARARRLRRRVKGRVLAVALATLATAGGALAAVSLLAGSSPPVRLPGGTDLCPSNYAYVADVRTKLVYPPNYPGFPESGDIRCFASAQNARADGYRFAPAPAGDTRVGVVYLGTTPADVRRTCARAQRLVHAVVYCPGRLPTPWIHPAINWDCPTANCFASLLSLTGSFDVPQSYVGSAPGVGDATIWEATAGQQRAFPYLIGCLSTSARLVSRTRFRGHPAAWYRCSGSVFGGSPSSMLEWHFGKEAYGITADGPPGLRRRLVLYLATHLVRQGRRPGS